MQTENRGQRPTDSLIEVLVPCFAADTAVGCESSAVWRLDTGWGPVFVCEKHLKLVTVKFERAGLEPRARPLEAASRDGDLQPSLS
jgi:hypothetical protein